MKQVTVKVPSRTIGLDLSDDKSSFCVLDGRGRIVREDKVQTEASDLRRVFGELRASRVLMEASPQCHWVAKLLRSLGHEVIVINPRRLQLISESVKKTDRNDARMLAKIGRLDLEMLQPVHEKSEETLAVRMAMRARAQLVGMRTRLVNVVRNDMKTLGSKAPSCNAEVFHKKVRRCVPEVLRPALEPLLEILSQLQTQIESYDKSVAEHCERHAPIALFREIYGVGPILALAFAMAVEDPKRFPDSRQLGAYFGLVPKTSQSGESDPHLRISKQGDRAVRSLLVTAATHLLKQSAPDSDLKRFGRRVARGGTRRDRARARVAVARKLAVLMHRMWLTGEVYRPLRCEQAA